MSEIQVKDLIISAIKNKKVAVLKEIFETVPTIDIAEALDDVEDVSLLIYPFRVISSEYTGELFAELSSEQQEKIINALTDKDLIKLLEESTSRSLDNTETYIWSKNEEDLLEDVSYKIINISNEGSNDGIFIEIERE